MTCITSQMICKNYNFADILFAVNLKLILGKYNRCFISLLCHLYLKYDINSMKLLSVSMNDIDLTKDNLK